MNSAPRYDSLAIALHWVLAVAILASIASGLYASSLPISPARLRWVNWHKWLGFAVLLVSCLRLAWRIRHPAPALSAALLACMPQWQRSASAGVHAAMYVLFIAIPLAGWAYSSAAGFPIVWLGVLPLPDLLAVNKDIAPMIRVVHQILAYGLCMLVAVHVTAVIKHQWVDRDGLLRRMLPERGTRP